MFSEKERDIRAKIATILNDDPVTQLPDAPNAIASISVDLVELLFNELLNTGDAEGTLGASRLATTCKFAHVVLKFLKHTHLELTARALTTTPSPKGFFDALVQQELSRLHVRTFESAVEELANHCATKHCQHARKMFNVLTKKKIAKSAVALTNHALKGKTPAVRVAWGSEMHFAGGPTQGAVVFTKHNEILTANWLENSPQYTFIPSTELRVRATQPIGRPKHVRCVCSSECGFYAAILSSATMSRNTQLLDLHVVDKLGKVVGTTLSKTIFNHMWFFENSLCVSITEPSETDPEWTNARNDWTYNSHSKVGKLVLKTFSLAKLEETSSSTPLVDWQLASPDAIRMDQSSRSKDLATSAVIAWESSVQGVNNFAASVVTVKDVSTSLATLLYFMNVKFNEVAREVVITKNAVVIAIAKAHIISFRVHEHDSAYFPLQFSVDMPYFGLDWTHFGPILPSPCGRFVLFFTTSPTKGFVMVDTEKKKKLEFKRLLNELTPKTASWNSDGLWTCTGRCVGSRQHAEGLLLNGVF